MATHRNRFLIFYFRIEQAIHNNYLVLLIREQVFRISDKSFAIQWIPSHVGIDGNEEADDYANRGCLSEVISALKLTYSDVQWEIRRRMIED